MALGEDFSALPVYFVETQSAQRPAGICTLVFELHGTVFSLGKVLERTLGVGLVFQSALPAAPVDGPKLHHLGKERDHLLEDNNRLDGSFSVLGSLAGKLGKSFEVYVLCVLISQPFAEEEMKAERTQDRIKIIPLPV